MPHRPHHRTAAHKRHDFGHRNTCTCQPSKFPYTWPRGPKNHCDQVASTLTNFACKSAACCCIYGFSVSMFLLHEVFCFRRAGVCNWQTGPVLVLRTEFCLYVPASLWFGGCNIYYIVLWMLIVSCRTWIWARSSPPHRRLFVTWQPWPAELSVQSYSASTGHPDLQLELKQE